MFLDADYGWIGGSIIPPRGGILRRSLGGNPLPTITPANSPSATPVPSGTATGTPTPTRVAPGSTATPCSMSFSDVRSSDYFYEPVQYLYCRGVLSGYGDNTFRPYNSTTRGQLTKIVVTANGWPIYIPATPTFSDVPPNDTFYPYIETAVNRGIITGYSDGTFRPYNTVTRGQLSKIVVLAEEWTLVIPATPTFSDVPADHTFYAYVETAYSRGIITGYNDSTFRLGNEATRGQISKIVFLAVRQP